MRRIVFLDGLRGLAIGLVLAFHGYMRWAAFYPFGNRFADIPVISYGWLGVHLFFLISGFVIVMTLEKCPSFYVFMVKRWLRLFPAMLICSCLIFFTAHFFWERPNGIPVWRDLLPGLFFVEPSWLAYLSRSPQGLLEGAFWSLFVEMKFYVIFGLAYFYMGRRKAIALLIVLFAVSLLGTHGPRLHGIARISGILSTPYFGWFAAGALFYRFYSTGKSRYGWEGLLLGILSACGLTAGGQSVWMALGIVGIFAGSVFWKRMQNVCGNPVLVFLGFVSYPLYLLHENLLVALTIKLGHTFPRMPVALMPILPMLALSLGAWVVAKWLEPWVRHGLTKPGDVGA